MEYKKTILWILSFAVMVCIFCLSSQPAPESNELSKGVAESIIDKTPHIKDLPPAEKQSLAIDLNRKIRNYAHFFLFFILGTALALSISFSYGGKLLDKYVIALIISIIYAISDEIHQIFVPGRSFQFTDILTDSAGSLLGIAIIGFILKRNVFAKLVKITDKKS